MSNELTNPTPKTRRLSSTSVKLIQAAALAAALVPLGSVAMEADTITCRFNNTGYGYYGNVGGSGCFSSTQNSSIFDFGDYVFELSFALQPNTSFDVEVVTTTNIGLDTEAMPGYECIQLSAEDGCVDFKVNTFGALSGSEWTHYTVAIDWDNWASPQTLEAARMRLLHDSSKFDEAEAPGTYDFDMCITGGYDECDIETDPRIGSGDTDFDSFAGALTVPEPSSLILLLTGVGAALSRKRRRSMV